MSINQLHDDGAVIGYKPTLEYKKELATKASTEATTSVAGNQAYAQKVYSETLESLKNNLPSASLDNIQYVTNHISTLIDKLSKAFENEDWQQYNEISSFLAALENHDDAYVKDFLEYHQGLTGSIIPELIETIYYTKERLQVLQDLMKEMYYGSTSITQEEAQEKDQAYLQKIQFYESNAKASKINYLAITSDATLNRSITMYAFGANAQAINIANIITKQDNTLAKSPKQSTIERLFSETTDELKYRKSSNERQQSIEIMQKTLYNYYNKRQEILDLYDIFDGNNEFSFLGNKIQICHHFLGDAMENVNRAFVGNQHYLSEMTKLESEKYFLKNLYATFNYKSGE